MCEIVKLIVFIAFLHFGFSQNLNITNFSNCVDVPMDYQNDAEIKVMDIVYEANAKGFIDVINAKFQVHEHRDHAETELVMTIYTCAKGTTGTCTENPIEHIEKVNCMRFHTDDSGPWHMFAPAMDTRNKCGEAKGIFEIKGAKLEPKFFFNYLDIKEGRYRLRMLVHLPGKSFDVKNLRGCVELDFDVVN